MHPVDIFQQQADDLRDIWQSTLWDIRQRIAPQRDGRYIPVAMRRAIMQRDRLTCRHCQRPGTADVGPDGRGWHIDHITPLSKGGQTALYNLALSCATCNQRKAAK